MSEKKPESAEDEKVKDEIFELLYAAGYNRVRSKEIDTFDKILGGMVYCLGRCDILMRQDVVYDYGTNIKTRIATTETIVRCLENLKCPFSIEPHQIQGLDFKSIYPVVQWLVKKTFESVKERQNKAYFLEWFSRIKYVVPEATKEEIQEGCRELTHLIRQRTPGVDHPVRAYKRSGNEKVVNLEKDVRWTLAEYMKEVKGIPEEPLSEESPKDFAEPSQVGEETPSTSSGGKLENIELKRQVATNAVRNLIEEAMVDLYEDETPRDRARRTHIENLMSQYDINDKMREVEELIEKDAMLYLETKARNMSLVERWRKMEGILSEVTEQDIDEMSSLLDTYTTLQNRSKKMAHDSREKLIEIDTELLELKRKLSKRYEPDERHIAQQLVLRVEELDHARIDRIVTINEISKLQNMLDRALTVAVKSQYHKRAIELGNDIASLNTQLRNLMTDFNARVDINHCTRRICEFVQNIEEMFKTKGFSQTQNDAILLYLNDIKTQLKEYEWKSKLTAQKVIEEKKKQNNIRIAIRAKQFELDDRAKFLRKMVEANQRLISAKRYLDRESAALNPSN